MSGNDGRPAGDQAGGPGQAGNQPGPGGIPPSFGASKPAPPVPSAPPVPPAPPAPEAPAPASAAPAPDETPDDPASVGWYPSTPAAGPFASPSAPSRRRVPRPSWGGRGTLMNVLLFGAGPLAMAGILVAAFVLVAPGKGAASSLGFKAGPAPSTQPVPASVVDTPSPSPSATPSAHKKKHPHATSSPSVPDKTARPGSAKKKARATPKPTRKSGPSGGVTPHNLGVPNFNGYCRHIGHHTAEVVTANAYGWRCTLYPSLALNAGRVCAWSYHLSSSKVIDVTTSFSDPNAWQCWRVNRYLGPLDVAAYCAQAGLGTSKLVADNATGWYCTAPSAPVDTTAACNALYHVSSAVSRFTLFTNPSSWQCWD